MAPLSDSTRRMRHCCSVIPDFESIFRIGAMTFSRARIRTIGKDRVVGGSFRVFNLPLPRAIFPNDAPNLAAFHLRRNPLIINMATNDKATFPKPVIHGFRVTIRRP